MRDATQSLVEEYIYLSGATEHDLRGMWMPMEDLMRMTELAVA